MIFLKLSSLNRLKGGWLILKLGHLLQVKELLVHGLELNKETIFIKKFFNCEVLLIEELLNGSGALEGEIPKRVVSRKCWLMLRGRGLPELEHRKSKLNCVFFVII